MNEDPRFTPIPADFPSELAEVFVRRMADLGFSLSFNVNSLVGDFEEAIEKFGELIREEWFWIGEVSYDLETGAGCYFGETLRLQFSGTWLGKVHPNSGANFYTTRIRFGEYLFSPFSWLTYRLSNGRSIEGKVESCLAAVMPSMKDGIDYKKRKHEEVLRAGGVVVDKEVF